MAISTVFPAAGTPRPAGTILDPSQGEKLRFTLSTDSPAPIFAFLVDAVAQWDQGSAKVQTTQTLNTYTWDQPTGKFGHNQLQDLFLKVMILGTETYTYRIAKVDAAGALKTLVEESMSGAGSIERSDFMLGLK
jgi:hypothetical protein